VAGNSTTATREEAKVYRSQLQLPHHGLAVVRILFARAAESLQGEMLVERVFRLPFA
jgi:hypothetical protein